MSIAEEYTKLWDEVRNAKTKEERAEILERLDSLVPGNVDTLAPVFERVAYEAMAQAQQVVFKEKFDYLSKTLSMSNVAKTYFGKSSAWMNQRINNHKVNGKPAVFSRDDMERLKEALKDIASKLTEIADSI